MTGEGLDRLLSEIVQHVSPVRRMKLFLLSLVLQWPLLLPPRAAMENRGR